MALHLQVPQQPDEFRPRICVVGVGGAGGNAVNNMIASGLEGVEFLVCNTDAQDLSQSLSDNRLQLGPTVTKGLGAGMQPQVGAEAAQESLEEILHRLDGANMVFITAGMGGGTGTGAAPVIAKALRERHVLTVGVVTKPFQFEGLKRSTFAEEGLANLSAAVDTLIVIPNQNLFRLANEKTTFADAFKMADNVLLDGVRGVSDLIVKPGIVNLDFADVRTLMTVMGKAMMGTGEAEGETRALEAAERAIANPLLDDMSLDGAQGVLINVTGGYDVTLYEVDAVANHVREKVDPEANIIFGSSVDESMTGTIRVSVVATGIDADQMRAALPHHGQPTNPMGPGPSGPPPSGPGGGMPQQPMSPAAPQAQPAPMSPFGRSPFAFRSGAKDQRPKSEADPSLSAQSYGARFGGAPAPTSAAPAPVPAAPAQAPSYQAPSYQTPSYQAPSYNAPYGAAQTSAAAADSQDMSLSHNYASVPPARSSMSVPVLKLAETGQDTAPAAAPAADGGADLFASAPSAHRAQANQTAQPQAAQPQMGATGGLFSRFAASESANPSAPTGAAPHFAGGAAVAAANVGMQEMHQTGPMDAQQSAPALADLDATTPDPSMNFEPSQADDGPRVVDIDDSSNSGLESFDKSYKSVPAFLRQQNN